MTPFAKRNLLIPVSVIFFGGLLYGFNKLIPALGTRIQHLEFIAISIMIAMSLVVMLLWASLGVFGGLTSFLVAMVFLHRSMSDLNLHYYSVLILIFFLSSYIGHRIRKKINESNQRYKVDIEKNQEDTNLIRNHAEKRGAEVTAVGEKVESLLKIKKIADLLSLSLSDEDIVKIVPEQIFDIFGGDNRVLLFMNDTVHKELNLSGTSKDGKRKKFTEKKGGIFDRWVLGNMKSLLVKDVSKDFRFSLDDSEKKDDAVSLIIKPLIVESNVLGILRVDSPCENAFGQHELRLLDIAGELAAVALENARLYRRTEELAIRDSLTGLYVHRYFMERLEENIKRALRSKSSFAMLMVDIDNFKKFNDKYGHISGDIILRNIGRILNSKASAGDIVSRYGGEEFAFLALNCDRREAVNLADSIREEIQNNTIVLRRKKCYVTVSIGVSVFPEDARLREDVIWEADRCLYQAKEEGKNRVCSK